MDRKNTHLRWLIPRRLAPSRPPATRFVILSSARTGSNLLQTMLSSHEQIASYGELFNQDDPGRILWNNPRPSSAEDVALRDADPCGFLERRVFAVPRSVRAVGFKLFYFHAPDGPWSAIWPYLRSMPGLRVIHIRRINIQFPIECSCAISSIIIKV